MTGIIIKHSILKYMNVEGSIRKSYWFEQSACSALGQNVVANINGVYLSFSHPFPFLPEGVVLEY